MFQLFAVSAVVMGLSYTISKEALFAPMRARCGGREKLLGYLISCPYCLSHWVAFLLVPLTRCYYVQIDARLPHWLQALAGWFLSSILVTVVAAFLRVIFFFVDETQGLVRRQKSTVEHELREEEESASRTPEPRTRELIEPPIH